MATLQTRPAEVPAPGKVVSSRDIQNEREMKTVYVSNLIYTLQSASLQDVFEESGFDVTHVELLKKGTGSLRKGCGLAVVTFADASSKEQAIQKLNGKLLYGRPIILHPSKFV
uniref:RRM domain-containing protein n=1 Tax=Tetraselmis sp. GSL018 TaxID=582737 RepID=A0A061R732_9CHLO|mmetsp:Transcript_29584/g.70476  ORF Transcript_29584/g.70476 Transcript_29584/m.70476 type:complete len:113 (+) Transcript_29584:876-1214(+)|eukprot:CAMPEP_0177600034 /NCGR_PEP_ID=MMETSP0419_2-20121207/13373_1 /TAXON_ID=582737 /ORGANISM="Tetraselmis sp., Strain GSL018" /LENGTH=112 /DNA_ID=CAMNT_0019092931 /DNA_START=167 /DNA_END=505 /DNA_ORIENTATION=+